MAAVEPTSTQNFGQLAQQPSEPVPSDKPPAHTYEYLIRDYALGQQMSDLEAALNDLGSQGWRLVTFGSIHANMARALFIREY